MRKRLTFALVAMLFLAGCNMPQAPADTSGKGVSRDGQKGPVVVISGYAFSAADLTIQAGQTVTWNNQDAVVHSVVAEDGSWASRDLKKGDSFSHRFTTPGKYPYRCGVHYEMKGNVTVEP